MLHDNRDFRALEAYCTSSADPETWKWYGQYLEARGDAAGARAQYQRAKDVLSLVRLACSAGDYRAAADLCLETGDRAGAFHLARALEAAGSPRDALIFYEKSGRYNHAVRLAKASGTDAELLTLALAAERGVQMDVARHFEDRGHVDRAVQLYRKGGALGRAIDLCFAHGLFEDLRAIAEEMGPDTNPELLRRCADFFISKGQFDKAVSLLITGRRYAEAADMCVAHKIEMTEAMAEAMTPPKPGGEDSATLGGAGAAGAGDSEATLAAAREARNGVLVKIAKALKRQGAFHLATKKYTQAGEKVKAIKSLLRSGDTEKIIFFANKTRSPEVYTLAANYLQTLSWHTDAEILGAITEFYGKAKAHEQLSSFYEACAAVEIDEYRNYEKALAALKEALKAAARIKGDIREARTSSLTGRIAIVERFVAARKLAKTDMPAMAEACRGLLELRDAETAIRVGDVYALLVYYHAQQKQWGVAFDLVEDMRGRGILLEPFIESAVLREIYT
jgi:intraflagellar transport protein 140